SRGCEGSTIRRKLSAVSSLFEYLCERNAVVHNPVKGVKRPKVTNVNEGLTPALSDEQARMLLEAPRGCITACAVKNSVSSVCAISSSAKACCTFACTARVT